MGRMPRIPAGKPNGDVTIHLAHISCQNSFSASPSHAKLPLKFG